MGNAWTRTLWITFLSLGLASCQGKEDKNADKLSTMVDSMARTNSPEALPVIAGSGSEPLKVSSTKGAHGTSLVLCQNVFPGFKVVEMDPMDGFPLFKTAKETEFLRLRHVKPAKTPIGSGTYPRILLKVYEFSSWEALEAEIEAYFDGMEHSAGKFELGKPMDALKTPPLLCLATETTFVMVQSTCGYHNEEWNATTTAFFDWAKQQNAKVAFEATCQAGKLRYEIGRK